MAKGNKKSGVTSARTAVSGSSKHLFGGDKGLHGPGRHEHTMGSGMTHKATTHEGKHHRTTRRGGNK